MIERDTEDYEKKKMVMVCNVVCNNRSRDNVQAERDTT